MSPLTSLIIAIGIIAFFILLTYLGTLSRSIYAIKVGIRKEIKTNEDTLRKELFGEITRYKAALLSDSQVSLQRHRELLEKKFLQETERLLQETEKLKNRLRALEPSLRMSQGGSLYSPNQNDPSIPFRTRAEERIEDMPSPPLFEEKGEGRPATKLKQKLTTLFSKDVQA